MDQKIMVEYIPHPDAPGLELLIEILPDQPIHSRHQIVNILVMSVEGGAVDMRLLADVHDCDILQLLVFHKLHQGILHSLFGILIPLIVFHVHMTAPFRNALNTEK